MINQVHGIPRLTGKGIKHFLMSRKDFLNGPNPKILCTPGPGQIPDDVASLGPCRDWPKAKQIIRVPQVVFISIMPDPTVFGNTASVRTNFLDPAFTYPFDGHTLQTNFQALPHANFGIGRSLDGGIGFTGFGNLSPQDTHFPWLFDTQWNREWPKLPKTVPARYFFGDASNPEPSYYQSMIEIANEVKTKIEHSRPGRTFVSVLPWVPSSYTWQDTSFTEILPTLKLNPGGNLNVVLFGPGAGTLLFGGWNDAFEAVQLGEFGHLTPPQQHWSEAVNPDTYNLEWVDLTNPANQSPYNYHGPAEIMVPQPWPGQQPFFGANFLHIYIGYRAWPRGPRLDDSILMGNLAISDVEALNAGHSLQETASASVAGFEQYLQRFSPYSTRDYLTTLSQNRKNYSGHRTMIFGFPTLGWSNTITFSDIQQYEQFWDFYGATLVGGLNPNLYNPSPFNANHPDFEIQGTFNLIKNGVTVPFWYPILERYPSWLYYNSQAAIYGTTLSFIDFLKQCTNEMSKYFSDTRTDFGDAWWRAQMDAFPDYAKCGITYEGQASGLDVTTLSDTIANYFGFKL